MSRDKRRDKPLYFKEMDISQPGVPSPSTIGGVFTIKPVTLEQLHPTVTSLTVTDGNGNREYYETTAPLTDDNRLQRLRPMNRKQRRAYFADKKRRGK